MKVWRSRWRAKTKINGAPPMTGFFFGVHLRTSMNMFFKCLYSATNYNDTDLVGERWVCKAFNVWIGGCGSFFVGLFPWGSIHLNKNRYFRWNTHSTTLEDENKLFALRTLERSAGQRRKCCQPEPVSNCISNQVVKNTTQINTLLLLLNAV